MRISDWSSDVCSSDLLTKHPGLPSGHVDDGQHGKAASPVPLSVEVPFLAVGQQLLELDPHSIGREPDFANILVLHHQFGSDRLRCRRRTSRPSCTTRNSEAHDKNNKAHPNTAHALCRRSQDNKHQKNPITEKKT